MRFQWRYDDGPMPTPPQGALMAQFAHASSQVRAPWGSLIRGVTLGQPEPFEMINELVRQRVNAMPQESAPERYYEDLAATVAGAVGDAMRGCRELYDFLGYRRHDLKCTVRLCAMVDGTPNPCRVDGVGKLAEHPMSFAFITWPERLIVLRHPAQAQPVHF